MKGFFDILREVKCSVSNTKNKGLENVTLKFTFPLLKKGIFRAFLGFIPNIYIYIFCFFIFFIFSFEKNLNETRFRKKNIKRNTFITDYCTVIEQSNKSICFYFSVYKRVYISHFFFCFFNIQIKYYTVFGACVIILLQRVKDLLINFQCHIIKININYDHWDID